MNENTPAITDQEIEALFTGADQQEIEQRRAEEIEQDLWDAINSLEIDTYTSTDDVLDDVLYDQLYQYAYDNNCAGCRDDISEDMRAYAAEKWTDTQREFEHQLLDHLRHCVYVQRYRLNEIETPAFFKKRTMAELCAVGLHDSQWLQLVDTLLEGEPLDESQSDDFELTAKAFEHSNALAARQQQLQNAIQAAFEVPSNDDHKQLQRQIEAADQITRVVVIYSGDARQPDRHAAIDKICRDFHLHPDAPSIEKIRELSDNYTSDLSS